MWGGVLGGHCAACGFSPTTAAAPRRTRTGPRPGRPVKQQLIRFLAIFAAVSALLLRLLQPAGAVVRHARRPLARRHSKRSYLNGGICGEGPISLVPTPFCRYPTKRSGYINNDGRLVLPEGAEFRRLFPPNLGIEVLTDRAPAPPLSFEGAVLSSGRR